MPTDSETILAAADLLEARTTAAREARPGAWRTGTAATVISPRPGGYEYVTGYTTSEGTGVADYIATMDPAAGTALVDLLRDLADRGDEGVVNPWALDLAHKILAKENVSA